MDIIKRIVKAVVFGLLFGAVGFFIGSILDGLLFMALGPMLFEDSSTAFFIYIGVSALIGATISFVLASMSHRFSPFSDDISTQMVWGIALAFGATIGLVLAFTSTGLARLSIGISGGPYIGFAIGCLAGWGSKPPVVDENRDQAIADFYARRTKEQ